MNENDQGQNGEAVEIIPPAAKKKRRKNPLATLPGLIQEAGRIYRQMKSGKIDHEKGRSLMWSLSQIRPMIEAQELQSLLSELGRLEQLAEQRGYGGLPTGTGRELTRLPN